jgi:hypothetical protein
MIKVNMGPLLPLTMAAKWVVPSLNRYRPYKRLIFQWYFLEYANDAEDDDKAAQMAAHIKDYGIQQFEQPFENRQVLRQYYKAKVQLGDSLCIEISGSPAFHT